MPSDRSRAAEIDRLRADLARKEAALDAAIREVGEQARARGYAEERGAQLLNALAFAASCIKSGERWSPTCEDVIGGALRREKAQRGAPPCGICGGREAEIRPRHPGEPPRKVCPTCIADRLARIHEESSPTYGVAYAATPDGKEE